MRVRFMLTATVLLALCVCLPAFAEVTEKGACPEEPALTNPRDKYEYYVDTTDGSEELLYMLLDSMNDEDMLVKEHGSVSLYTDFINESGDIDSTATIGMLMHDGERIMRMNIEDTIPGVEILVMIDRTVMLMNGEIFSVSETSAEPELFEQAWEWYCFPWCSIETMHGIRQDENGFTYYLTAMPEGGLCEYVTDSSIRIVDTRIYDIDENGDYRLSMRIHFTTGTEAPIPDNVLAVLFDKEVESEQKG